MPDPRDKKSDPPPRSSPPPRVRSSVPPKNGDRRSGPRIDVAWTVDYSSDETFLYAYIQNISALGIFITTRHPPAVGTIVTLRFTPPGEEPLELQGEVTWINPWHENGENINPGFGVRFTQLTPEIRERLVNLVHAIAYLD